MKNIALLATGDEIVQGDVINTNASHIARQLSAEGMTIGNHVAATDAQEDMEEALKFLLDKHDTIITIGGLGPTSDDRTRFAIAEVIGCPLTFDEASWNMICERLNRFHLDIPESNRQQCLFPQNSKILANHNGTANGCHIKISDKNIYMLPGPPNECLPLFEQAVLPSLKQQAGYAQSRYRQDWLLLNVSEGTIAAQIDQAIDHAAVSIGYRVAMPYLEVKLFAPDICLLKKYQAIVEKLISKYCVSHDKKTASQQLCQWLQTQQQTVYIDDQVSRGLLQQRLSYPGQTTAIRFAAEGHETGALSIRLCGLQHYWQANNDQESDSISWQVNGNTQPEIITPLRRRATLERAIEAFCWQLLQILKAI
jgi:nicotinamide-nucleotide amidase